MRFDLTNSKIIVSEARVNSFPINYTSISLYRGGGRVEGDGWKIFARRRRQKISACTRARHALFNAFDRITNFALQCKLFHFICYNK